MELAKLLTVDHLEHSVKAEANVAGDVMPCFIMEQQGFQLQ